MARISLDERLRKPVIPVLWEPPRASRRLLQDASIVLLQGGDLLELTGILEQFRAPDLSSVAVFAHVDLIAGLENSIAGLEFLASLGRIDGIVTVHPHLATSARKLNLCSIIRLFLSDTRAVERGLTIAVKSPADAIEIMPAAAATKVAGDFAKCSLPRIAGGLCRTEADVREALASGCRAVTSTRPKLWELNSA